MKKRQQASLNQILTVVATELDALPEDQSLKAAFDSLLAEDDLKIHLELEDTRPPVTKRVLLGYVAINKKTQIGATGASYTSGCKAYKSEAVARAAIRRCKKEKDFHFLPAYAFVPI